MLRLEDKVCLVTGARKGIGAETARLMAQASVHVIVSDVCEQSAINVCNQIKDEDGSALGLNLDASSSDVWRAVVAKINSAFKNSMCS